MKPNFSKYRAKKTEVDGIIFDSKKEAKRYEELKALEYDGKISDLQLQVKFVLIPTQREPDRIGARAGIIRGRVIEKECAYVADFTYNAADGFHVEDVKGMREGAAYSLFKVKKKMMLYFYGIRVEEV